jgi:flavin-dependent dehydrogenase
MRHDAIRHDAIVVGAGVAGAAAAIHLARAGGEVLLLERERGPAHKVCGEFVSAPAAAQLRALGLEPAALGAEPITGLRLVEAGRVIDAPLPFEAWGLSRHRLDAALRDRAVAAGAALRLGCSVRRIADGRVDFADDGPDGDSAAAKAVLLATGKHDLAGHRRCATDTRRMIGFKLHLRLEPRQAAALASRIELHVYPGGYAGLQPVGDAVANLSLVIDAAGFAAAGRSFAGVLSMVAPGGSLLADRLHGHAPLWPRPLAVAGIPYGFRLWRAPVGPDWLWPIGDQAIVTPSFTGDGMALALSSAAHASAAMLRGEGPDAYRRTLRQKAARPLATACALDRVLASPRLRALAFAATSTWPSLAAWAAQATRLPAGAGGGQPPA